MIATRVLLILSVLPMLSQAAPKPKPKQNGGQSSALQALFTNANMLREFTKIGMENYKTICGNCDTNAMSLHTAQRISEKTVKKAVEDTERVLYPFIKLLLGMFKGEKDLSLKGNLRNTGNKLNETYDSAVTMMGTTSLPKHPKNTQSLALLRNETSNYIKNHGKKNQKVHETLYYFVLQGLNRQAYDITYSIGKLTNSVYHSSQAAVKKGI